MSKAKFWPQRKDESNINLSSGFGEKLKNKTLAYRWGHLKPKEGLELKPEKRFRSKTWKKGLKSNPRKGLEL